VPLVVKLKIPRRADRLDARQLVARAADAAREELSRALVKGYAPETGAPRPPNAKGRPQGFNTGKLARGLTRSPIKGGKARASATIDPPADRADWVARRGDVLVVDGTVAQAIQRAADDYVSETI
jgi:hypothetical protein